MSHRLIAVSGVLSLAACVASPVNQNATAGSDGIAVSPTPSASVSPLPPSVTTMAHGEEEDGSGTMMTSMAIGEEDGNWPVITSLAHGEEEDGSGTQIEEGPIILPEPQSFLAEPAASHQLASVTEIMARLRLDES